MQEAEGVIIQDAGGGALTAELNGVDEPLAPQDSGLSMCLYVGINIIDKPQCETIYETALAVSCSRLLSPDAVLCSDRSAPFCTRR